MLIVDAWVAGVYTVALNGVIGIAGDCSGFYAN